MLSAKEIRRKEFDKVKFGYQSDDVDAFLKQVEADYRSMEAEREESKKKIQLLAEKICQYKEQEEDLKNALLIAQKQARQIVDEAKEKAAKIVEDARGSVDSVKAEAIAAQEKQLAEVTAKLNRENQILADAHRQVADFKHSVFDLYRAHLNQLSQLPDDVPTTAEQSAENAEDAKKTEEPAKAEEKAAADTPVKDAAPEKEPAASDDKKADAPKEDAKEDGTAEAKTAEPESKPATDADSKKDEATEKKEDTPAEKESDSTVKRPSFEAEIETVETLEAEIVSEEHPDEPQAEKKDSAKTDDKLKVNPEITVEAVPQMNVKVEEKQPKDEKRSVDPFAQDNDSLPPPRTISHTAEFDTRYQNLRNGNRREEKKKRR